ncbi:MAG: RNA-binding protein, partial [Phycisphaerales bacterium]|nr:RNA-binding protein [Phycisphaerales bacterium]
MFKVYIGNLENGVTLEQIKELLAPFTDLEDVVLVMDPETGQSRCFAIAMFRDATRGQLVIETLQGKMHCGRPLVLNESVKKRKGLPPKKEPMRPRGMGGGSSGGMNRQMGGGQMGGGQMGGGQFGGGSRVPSRNPSGRPSSRPTSRSSSRPDFGGDSTSGQGRFFRGPGSSAGGSGGVSRPGGSSGFSRPTTPGISRASGPGSTTSETPSAPSGGGVPVRAPVPKAPPVKRLETPPGEGTTTEK